MNLLQETKEDIESSGHSPADIVFIGSVESGHQCSWIEYKDLADFDYDSGYGGQEVARDLRIYFSDGSSMWRHEYDGSERWEYSDPFKRPTIARQITKLADGNPWSSLEDLHKPGGKYGLDDE